MGRSLARIRFLRSVPEDPFSLDRLVDGRGAIPAASSQSLLRAEVSGTPLEQGIEDLPPVSRTSFACGSGCAATRT
jgi:hypothetical protein